MTQRMTACVVIAVAIVLTGCTKKVILRNPRTGATATCGRYKNGIITGSYAVEHERRCLDDYEKQGYVRVPR